MEDPLLLRLALTE